MKLTWKYLIITHTYISLELKNYVKYIGVLINENLSSKYHIVQLASKISTTIGIIARLRHFVPLASLRRICITDIQPYLLHGIVAWGRAANAKFVFSKKRARRLMYFRE